jgi:Helitron helicase-like domain at N-terminus
MRNQSRIFGEMRPKDSIDTIEDSFVDSSEFIDPERVTYNNTNRRFLPESMSGSPRHLKAMSLNALCIVSEYGKPTVFITGTVNPEWPELKEALMLRQTVYDSPEIVCQVFLPA